MENALRRADCAVPRRRLRWCLPADGQRCYVWVAGLRTHTVSVTAAFKFDGAAQIVLRRRRHRRSVPPDPRRKKEGTPHHLSACDSSPVSSKARDGDGGSTQTRLRPSSPHARARQTSGRIVRHTLRAAAQEKAHRELVEREWGPNALVTDGWDSPWKSFAKPQNPTNYAGRGDPAAEFQVSLYVPWAIYAKRLQR